MMRTLLLLLPALVLFAQTAPGPKAATTVKTAAQVKTAAPPATNYKGDGFAKCPDYP